MIDTNAEAFSPIHGRYSAFLFGGGLASVAISQTGLVPAGTKSLQFDAYWFGAAFVVSIGNQTLPVAALQAFPKYTHYGADISAYAGQTVTLTFTEPPPAGVSPSMFLLDSIQFSEQPIIVPEPSVFGLFALGSMLLGWRRGAQRH